MFEVDGGLEVDRRLEVGRVLEVGRGLEVDRVLEVGRVLEVDRRLEVGRGLEVCCDDNTAAVFTVTIKENQSNKDQFQRNHEAIESRALYVTGKMS